MKKVLVIFPKLSNLGGAEKVIIYAMDVMYKIGYSIVLITENMPNREETEKLYGIDIEKVINKFYKVNASQISDFFKGTIVYQKEKQIRCIENIIKKEKPSIIFISQANMPKLNTNIPKLAFIWCPFTRYLYKDKIYKPKSSWRQQIDKKVEECPEDYILTCNSEWTKEKIKQIWNCESLVLYPPCDINKKIIDPTKKKNWICTVSRFNKNKYLEIAIEAIKKLPNLELHLIGIAKNKRDIEYLEYLKKNSNKRCFFHVNISQKEKKGIINKSKYSLHLAGVKMHKPIYSGYEHFGIAVAEMLNSGCVLQHYKYGFFPEFILDEKQKFSNVNDIIKNIKNFEKNDSLYKEISLNNQKITKKYSNEEFEKNLIKIIDEIKI